jgi:transcriptional regulator with XRE-family HTH domain
MSELGTLLVRAREARGLTLEDAERDTRISRRYLQALESEQFEAIPAPVYARGFLRSYSQYLGLDPQEMLALFPRDDDHAPAQPVAQNARGGRQQQPPQSAVGPARPSWRGPQPQQQQAARQAQQAPRSQQSMGRQRPPDYENDQPLEPMIGVDIGVPAAARRIHTDPAAQTRSLAILVVAIGAVAGVILLAFLISNCGGSSAGTPPGASSTAKSGALASSAQLTQIAQGGAPTQEPSTPASGLKTTPGMMPDLSGQPVDKAKLALGEAGYTKISVTNQKNAATKGTVFDQSPAAGVEWPTDSNVNILVSDGPG